MAIKIVEDGPEITMTRSEYQRLMREYGESISFMVNAPSFEEWVRGRTSSVTLSLDDLPKRTGDFLHAVAPGRWLPKQ